MKLTANKGHTTTERHSAKLDLADLEYRVVKMWEKFPNLHLPHKYGEDLLERNQGMLVVPDPADVTEWPRRKMEQYYVALSGNDPAEWDDTGLRLRLQLEVKKRLADRKHLDNVFSGNLHLSPAKVRAPQSNIVRITVKKKK